MDPVSDERLLEAVIAGERPALSALVDRYQQELTGYLNRLVGPDWALAQDLAQETFLRVLRQHTNRGERPFKPWLYAIATNLARDYFKSSAARRSSPLIDEQADALIDEVPGPEEHALQHEQQAMVVAAMNQLNMDYRVTLWLRFYGGLSLAEIAAITGSPLGTVKWRLSTGLQRLRSALASTEIGDPCQEAGCE